MDKETFEKLLNGDKENEHLEFKEAREQFNLENGTHSLFGYYVALANEKGGTLILGVTDKIPRKVVGTKAFLNLNKVKEKVYQKFNRIVKIDEIEYDKKRVLVFNIPSRPIGEPLNLNGITLMRSGESLINMPPKIYQKILTESIPDYSAEIAKEVQVDDLDEGNIKVLRKLLKQSPKVNKKIEDYTDEQLLADLGLIKNKKVTNAALILLGNEQLLKDYFPHAEVRYQFKEDKNKVRNDFSIIFQGGYLSYYDKLWDTINSRNSITTIQVGLRVLKKPTFEEETIREAINNAIIHRDYSEKGSVIITQSPKEMKIESPGGLLEGVTIFNIVDETKPRNKLLSEVLSKCDFVESFGNGVDLMIQNQLSTGKNMPEYQKTTKYKVVLEIDGQVYDKEFAQYVSRVAFDRQKELNYKELILLIDIKDGKNISSKEITEELFSLGLIERRSNKKYMLSKKYYSAVGKKGEYTRRRGLDKQTNKELILSHLRNHNKGYMEEFIEVLKDEVPKPTINRYLRELRQEDLIKFVGNPQVNRGKNRGYWCLEK